MAPRGCISTRLAPRHSGRALAASHMRTHRAFALGGCLALFAAFLAVGCRSGGKSSPEPYRSSVSPDGRFEMVVYRVPTKSAMPGQAGDAPGFVRLYDKRTGRVLEQKDVEMVQNIDQFEWSATNLYIKLFADWKLPK
jgi:hypothetical protein